MASKNSLAPRLLDPPAEYSQEYMRKLLSVLRLYFNQLDNPSPEVASAQDVGTTKVVSASASKISDTASVLHTHASVGYREARPFCWCSLPDFCRSQYANVQVPAKFQLKVL